MRNKYDSAVVFLYAIGKESMMPYEFRKQIPSSTISTWRKTDYSQYLGHEFRYFFDDAFKNAEVGFKYLKLKKSVMALTRAWVMLSYALIPLIKNASGDKALQARVLHAINYIKDFVGLQRALKITGLSKPLYYQWMLEARFDCFDSFTQLCVKRHPQQLQMNEILKIKKLLTNPEVDHWPIVSIAGQALRQRKLIASLYSWYKYAKLWNISKKVAGKSRKTIGIVATKPNEYLHVDTTFYELINYKKVCISFVMDNYSKMILGWHVSDRNTFDIVRKSVSNALKNIDKHPDQKHSFLVTDGGSENHNKYLNAFIEKIATLKKYKVTKIRALKDIRFSNSPVEAVHRTMKSRYLKGRKFENIKALTKYLEWAVEDYNTIRPHYKHRPRTPHEVYFDIPLGFDIKKRVKNAIKTRIKNNKCAKCIQCRGCRPGECKTSD
ncbi:MAG: transposase [Bacteroidia bacterium]|nr:transposase [Bacteroidia bacterium]